MNHKGRDDYNFSPSKDKTTLSERLREKLSTTTTTTINPDKIEVNAREIDHNN